MREYMTEAHRRAGHPGRFDVCRDPMCEAIERYLHDREIRCPPKLSQAQMDRMVRG